MKIFKLVFGIFVLFFMSTSLVSAKEIIASVEISNSTLSDPLEVTQTPHNTTRQDLFQIKIDTVQFTKIDDLNLADRVEFEIEDFDFRQNRYIRAKHNIVMASVKPNDALVYIYSEPMQTILFKGVVRDFDLTGNGVMDIRLRYDGMNEQTGKGTLNVMRFVQEDYKIYGNTFCQREERNSDFRCVEVTDKNLGLYQEIELDRFNFDENDNLTDDEKVIKVVEENTKNETETVSVVEPVREEQTSFIDSVLEKLNFQIIMIIVILIFLFIIFLAWKKHSGNGGAEINFDD